MVMQVYDETKPSDPLESKSKSSTEIHDSNMGQMLPNLNALHLETLSP